MSWVLGSLLVVLWHLWGLPARLRGSKWEGMTKPREKDSVKRKTGRPSSYTEAIGVAFCARISAGESLNGICSGPGMPNSKTVLNWLSAYPSFAAEYARARERQADLFASQIIEIADTEEDANRARVMIDARKWYASKLKPKVYGDKLDVAVSHTLDLTNALDEARGRLANAAPALLDVTPNALPDSASTGDNDA